MALTWAMGRGQVPHLRALGINREGLFFFACFLSIRAPFCRSKESCWDLPLSTYLTFWHWHPSHSPTLLTCVFTYFDLISLRSNPICILPAPARKTGQILYYFGLYFIFSFIKPSTTPISPQVVLQQMGVYHVILCGGSFFIASDQCGIARY